MSDRCDMLDVQVKRIVQENLEYMSVQEDSKRAVAHLVQHIDRHKLI